MKLYQDTQTGSLYFLDNHAAIPDAGPDLMQAPLNSYQGIIDLDLAAAVDWTEAATEPSEGNLVEHLLNIKKELCEV